MDGRKKFDKWMREQMEKSQAGVGGSCMSAFSNKVKCGLGDCFKNTDKLLNLRALEMYGLPLVN